ncbi:hypothetical protein AB0465_11375 [Streptomyces griseoviridis]|uniref:hypothetical protein n=1 Tax=Streptomyces griseoviridis TaxID=45398 RepID=UPI00344B0E5C
MGLRNLARSLRPGNDRALAADLAAQQRARRSRAADRADRDGQQWEQRDRNQDRTGRDRQTNWRT